MALSDISKQFKVLRIMNDITRPQMAKAIGIPEKELVSIEQGKSQVTDALLQVIAEKYSPEDGYEILLETLRAALVKSVESITFDMKNLSIEQRERVVKLRDQIDLENAAEIEKQAKEAERLKKERAELRKQKRAEKELAEIESALVGDSADTPPELPEEKKVEKNELASIDDEKLSDDEMMALLSLED
jgi:DNA-binding XRE family transcriptional regulator